MFTVTKLGNNLQIKDVEFVSLIYETASFAVES